MATLSHMKGTGPTELSYAEVVSSDFPVLIGKNIVGY